MTNELTMHPSKSRSFTQMIRRSVLKFVADCEANVRAQEKLAVAVPNNFKRGL